VNSQLTRRLVGLFLFLLATSSVPAIESRGSQFFAFTRFDAFQKSAGESPRDLVLISPRLHSRIQANELVASWNMAPSCTGCLKIEACAFHGDEPTKYYCLGVWSQNSNSCVRQSVLHQQDQDGDVSTDTLILTKPADLFQLRLTLTDDSSTNLNLKFLALSVADTKAEPAPLSPNRKAWGKLVDVPERSQMAYPNGKVLCSPTTVSMLLSYWAQTLHRPELDRDVPEVAAGVYDANWKGTGNWPFNTAYAGSFPGMRGYVSRLSDISEIEDWVAAGLPVGLSVCYDRLRGKGRGPNGHLVVCVGFTREGNPIINDPGTSKNVRKIFPRERLLDAWAYSHDTAYLIYPENIKPPRDRFGHWDSAASRRH
jgi:hypothetical protein